MKLLIDTNVILDVLLKREPFFREGAEVLRLVWRDDVTEYISATTITDVYYIAYRQTRDRKIVMDLLGKLLTVLSVATVSEQEIKNALALDWKDFEDSVQYSSALFNEMDGIVTRNPSDYERADIPVWQPEQLLQRLAEK